MAATPFLEQARLSLQVALAALEAGLEALAAAQLQERQSLEPHLLRAEQATEAAWEAVLAALKVQAAPAGGPC